MNDLQKFIKYYFDNFVWFYNLSIEDSFCITHYAIIRSEEYKHFYVFVIRHERGMKSDILRYFTAFNDYSEALNFIKNDVFSRHEVS